MMRRKKMIAALILVTGMAMAQVTPHRPPIDDDFTDGPDPAGLKCGDYAAGWMPGMKCYIPHRDERKPGAYEMQKRFTITEDIDPSLAGYVCTDVGDRWACEPPTVKGCRPYVDVYGDSWLDCTDVIRKRGFVSEDVTTDGNCTDMQCAIHANRTCGIKGVSVLLYNGPTAPGANDASCIFRCPGESLPHNVIDCGGGGTSPPPVCCGECPGGCVDPDTGQPLPWECCPPPPDDDDVTSP